MAESLPDELQRAEKEGLAYTDLLLRLVRAQWHHRQETALEWRIRQARLPERWALPFVLLTREIFASREQILLHLYAATGVSCRTVDRSAVRSAVIAFRPDGVRW